MKLLKVLILASILTSCGDDTPLQKPVTRMEKAMRDGCTITLEQKELCQELELLHENK